MKLRFVVLSILAFFLFPACSTKVAPVAESLFGTMGEKRARVSWWRQLNDSALNQDIAAAFSANPSLRAVALRIEQAEAAVASARATTLPRVGLGFGYDGGRKREVDFGPYDLAPWGSSGLLSWEVDVSGKFRAAKNSAIEKRSAAVWDFHSARLLLASRIAAVRMNLYRFNSELLDLGESLRVSEKMAGSLKERSEAGLIPDSRLEKQVAENEKLKREKLELERVRDLTVVQLRSLRGGTDAKGLSRSSFPEAVALSTRPLNQLLKSHPGILAAEARIRSAFQMEQSARLDLLPSFQFNILATGQQRNLSDRFRTWLVKAGPSLDVPIYDPARLAVIKARQSEAKIASAEYQKTVLAIFEEVETARINFASRRAQLAASIRETKALDRARRSAREQFDAGLSSQIEYLDTERGWLDAKRSEAAQSQALLNARINFVKATGGGQL